jgi:hypothetical protein
VTVAARLARFVGGSSWADLSGVAREELKIRSFLALDCASARSRRHVRPQPNLQLEGLRAGIWGTQDTWGQDARVPRLSRRIGRG